jgi:hypothetical protein
VPNPLVRVEVLPTAAPVHQRADRVVRLELSLQTLIAVLTQLEASMPQDDFVRVADRDRTMRAGNFVLAVREELGL